MKVNVREHPIYKNIYVSDTGLIWEYFSGNQYTRDRNKRYPQCILGNIHYDKYGYEIYTPRITTCNLNNLQHRKKIKVHQLVAQTWIDNPCNYQIVDHIDYNKLNNRVSNLRWVSLAENNKGKHRKASGVDKQTRLACLRMLLVDKLTIKEVNYITGVTTNTLSEAKRGTTWLNEWYDAQRLGFMP